MNRRRNPDHARFAKATLPLFALCLQNCGGSSHTLPHNVPADPPNATRGDYALVTASNNASGVTEEDVKRIIEDIVRQGRAANFVTIKVGSVTHYFSPHDSVVRTGRALVVQTPRRLYAWKLEQEPIVRYSSWTRSISLSEIPFAASKVVDDAIDLAGRGKLRKNALGNHICADCDVLFGRKSAAGSSSGRTVTDPWQLPPQAASSQRSASIRLECGWNSSKPVCLTYSDLGIFQSVAPDYYYQGSPSSFTISLSPPCPVNITDASLAQAYKDRADIQAVAQAIASRNSNHAPPRILTQSPPPPVAGRAAANTTVNNNTIIFFPDNFQAYFDAGMTLGDILLHEMLHIWYETKGSDGHRPNPLPNDPGFSAHPVVQYHGTNSSTGAPVTVTLQFNLIDSAGHFDRRQYAGYEHALIHDDEVQATNGIGVWTSLTDAMDAASSVQVGDGTPTKVDLATAQAIMTQNGITAAGIANRGPRRPPTWPDFSAGCALTTSSEARQLRSTGRSVQTNGIPAASVSATHAVRTMSGGRRKSSLDEPIETYNLDGYDLIWDGPPAPPPAPPLPTCTPDSMGYCAVEYLIEGNLVPCSDGASYQSTTYHYIVYKPVGSARYTQNTRVQDDGAGNCSMIQYWDPVEPTVEFADPNLP